MAEEVEIVGVDGGPAAEATLRKLLVEMQKKNGTDASSAKVQEQYNKAKKEGTKVLDEFGNEVEEATSAVASFGKAAGGLISTIYNGLVGAISFTIDIFSNLVTAFASGEGTLSDFVAMIPFVGGALSSLTRIFDDSIDTWQSLSQVGAAFNNDLMQLKKSASSAYLTLDQFANLVANNSDKLAAMAGTVTKGAIEIGKLNKALGGQRAQLLGMGLNFEEINETMVDYAYLTRVQGRLDKRNSAVVAEEAAKYAKSLSMLSKLTGEDVKTLRDKNRAAQADMAFQIKLSKMGETERKQVQDALNEAQLAGPVAVQRLKEVVSGMPPMTRETQLFTSVLSEANTNIEQMGKLAMRGQLTEENRRRLLADTILGLVNQAESMGTILSAGSLSGEGVGAELSSILGEIGMDLATFLNLDAVAQRSLINERIKDASKENNATDSLTSGLLNFRNELKRVHDAFTDYIIDPLSDLLGPALEDFVDALSKMTKNGGLEKLGEQIESFINGISKDIRTDGDFKTTITKWLTSIKDTVINGMNSLIFGKDSVKTEEDKNNISALKKQLQEKQIELDSIQSQSRGANKKKTEVRNEISNLEKNLSDLEGGGFLSNMIKEFASFENLGIALGVGGAVYLAFKGFGKLVSGFKRTGPYGVGLAAIAAFLAGTYAFSSIASGINEISEAMSRTGDTKNLESFSSALGNLKEMEGLEFNFDTSKIKSFTDAIDELRQSLDNLNDELAQDNNGFFSNKRTDAGQLLEGLNAGSSSGSDSEVKRLNTTMMRVVGLLEKNQTQNAQIIDGLKKVRGEI